MKKSLIVAAVAGMAALAQAESQRAQFTHENLLPDYHKAEVGAAGSFQSAEAQDVDTYDIYARYTVITNLALGVAVPFKNIDTDIGDSETGVGDVRFGVELRAYEDILGYPYCIPHIDVDLPTGDEDKGLGTGDVSPRFGVSVGTKTWDELNWIADLTYAANGAGEPGDLQDVLFVSLSLVWDVSKKFAVLAEGRWSNEDTTSGDDVVAGEFGMTYKFTRHFALSGYVGGGSGGDYNPDSTSGFKAAYSF